MRKTCCSLAFLFILISVHVHSDESPLLGFFPQNRAEEQKYESLFLSTPSPEKARKWLRWLTEEPHPAGTEADKKTAEYVRDKLKEFGIEAEIVPYEVYLNYPKSASLLLTVPRKEELSLREKGETLDKDSYSESAYPAFHGYGASGKASGQ